VRVNAAGA